MKHLLKVLIPLAALAFLPASYGQSNSFPVVIIVDAGQTRGELKPIWRFFGADEPNFAYMKNGQKLLAELGQLGKPQVYFRAHHLLTSGDGVYALKFGSTSAYKEDSNGRPVYDWTINDRIFDSYLERGLKPYVQLGFMPEALSTHPQNYPHHPPVNQRAPVGGGQSYPPKDYQKWGELAFQWTRHCVEKYGRAEVSQWYWEVWNEPDLGSYWHGSLADYCKLYDYAIEGVRRALPEARVGGPETSGKGAKFLAGFLEHCAHGTNFVTGKPGSPLDFVSFHAKGDPVFTNGFVRMGMGRQLRVIEENFAVIESFPQFKKLPIVLGESDPEGCAACRNPRDAYRNGTMYSSYTAASFPRKLEIAAQHGLNLEGALTWAFEFEDQEPFAGFRQLASAGIDLPVLNVFRLFGRMGSQQLAVTSSAGLDAQSILQFNVRGQPDVSAWASRDKDKITVLMWHYHDDDLPGPTAAVTLKLEGITSPTGKASLTRYLIDAKHCNAYAAWKKMGAPLPLSEPQFAALEKAGRLVAQDRTESVRVEKDRLEFSLMLPRQAVMLVEIAVLYSGL